MKFVLAPDSFKESMTALQVADCMEHGIKRVFPDCHIVKVPMADGGEGTVQALVDATGGHVIQHIVTGPLNKPVCAQYGILGDGKTAVIEMASASGINHTNEKNRNPLKTSTYGTGELIKEALDQGAVKIIVGLGGSATNDGGLGMAMALGVRFRDVHGNAVPQGGGNLHLIESIDLSEIDNRIANTEFILACDVNNPLTGPEGASAVFGPQKGATSEMVSTLDYNLKHYSEKISEFLSVEINDIPGSGAAGGLGGGLLAFTKSRLRKGVDIVIEYTGLNDKLTGADYVFTGEGGIDFQTKFGKTPYGVAQAAKLTSPGTPVIAIAGFVGREIESLYDVNFTAVFGILRRACDLNHALIDGPENVTATSENIARLIKSGTQAILTNNR